MPLTGSQSKLRPRDGTIIEIRNEAVIKPWFGLYKWGAQSWSLASKDNRPCARIQFHVEPCSIGVGRDGHQWDSEHLSWRPFNGSVTDYTDPTIGAQYTDEYWKVKYDD